MLHVPINPINLLKAPGILVCFKMYSVSWTAVLYIEGILPKGPYLPCVSMAGRALLAGYRRHLCIGSDRTAGHFATVTGISQKCWAQHEHNGLNHWQFLDEGRIGLCSIKKTAEVLTIPLTHILSQCHTCLVSESGWSTGADSPVWQSRRKGKVSKHMNYSDVYYTWPIHYTKLKYWNTVIELWWQIALRNMKYICDIEMTKSNIHNVVFTLLVNSYCFCMK